MKTFLKLICVAIPIALVISQYTPYTSSFWESKVSEKEIIVNLVSLYFLLLGFALYLEVLGYHKENLNEIQTVTNKVINNTESKLISDKDFYLDFAHQLSKAESVASICYFSPNPPNEDNHEERKKYYKETKKIIKAKRAVNFRRIVRNTPQNIVWVKELIENFSNEPNFHLAIIDDSGSQRMAQALSVQVIDRKHTWFVAIEDHERSSHYRDLYVEGANCAIAMQGYFNRLWLKSEQIIISGNLTPKGIELQNRT